MNDDVSEIPSSGCNVLNSSTVIYNYNNNVRRTFTNVGGRWIYSGQSTNSTTPLNAVCIDVLSLNSNAQFEPIYHFISLSLVVLVCLMFFWVMKGLIYAFSRR